MNEYINLTLLVGIPAIAALVLCKVVKVNIAFIGTVKGKVLVFAFWCDLVLACLCLIKILLNEKDYTIVESLEEVSYKTYIHYSVPLILLALVLPVITKLIIKIIKSEKIISVFLNNAILIVVLFIIYDVKLTNLAILMANILSATLSAFISFRYKIKSEGHEFSINKRIYAYIALITFFWVVISFVYLPNELYLSNISEFSFSYGICLKYTLIFACLIFAVVFLYLTTILDKYSMFFWISLVFAFSFTSYIQVVGLNGTMNVLDGALQEWSSTKVVINLIIWCLIFIGSVLFVGKKKETALKILALISGAIALVQLVSLCSMYFMSGLGEGRQEEYVLNTKNQFVFDDENNTIIFVLDWYDTQIWDKVVESDDRFAQPLKDFIYYDNLSSKYAFTGMEIPYLLSGNEWSLEADTSYSKYAFEGDNLLSDIDELGCDVGIYTAKSCIDSSANIWIDNYESKSKNKIDGFSFFRMTEKISKFRYAPFIVKQYFAFDADQFNSVGNSDDVYDCNHDYIVYEKLRDEGITINKSYVGAFRFYHLFGAHASYEFTEQMDVVSEPVFSEEAMVSQAKGCMKVVYECIQRLKNEGIYDSATIVITADHGQNYFTDEYDKHREILNLEETSNPILFVKYPNQKADSLQVLHTMLEQNNLIASIAKALGLPYDCYGKSIDEVEVGEEYPRYMEIIRYPDIPYMKYKIEGYIKERKNWSLVEE